MYHRWVASLVVGMLCAAPALGAGFMDDFEGGALSPEWKVSFEGATGWQHAAANSNLVVTDVEMSEYGAWGEVALSRDASFRDEFEVELDFSWDGEQSDWAQQQLWVQLLDGEGESIVRAGYYDGWSYWRGAKFVEFRDGPLRTWQPGQLPTRGWGKVNLIRENGVISFLWDEQVLYTQEDEAPVETLRVGFGHYRDDHRSFFGSEYVDRVAIVPEPASLCLMGLAGLVAARRKHGHG